MLVVSTDTIPGKKITKVLGAIEARNNPLAFTLNMSKNAQRYLEKEAEKLGANAIVGFRIDFENIGSKNKSLLLAYAKGTAARIV